MNIKYIRWVFFFFFFFIFLLFFFFFCLKRLKFLFKFKTASLTCSVYNAVV